MKTKEFDEVIFRKEKGGDILAVFPYLIADIENNMTGYAHIGQHGPISYEYYLTTKRAKSPAEYADLLAEIKQIGYNPKIIKKIQRKKYSQAIQETINKRNSY